MSRRNRPPSESYRHGKRGRHKSRGSNETRRWEDEHLPPQRPVWMDRQLYLDLIRLRGSL